MKTLLNGADSFLQVLGNARALVAVMFAVSALSLASCSKDDKEDKKAEDTEGTEAYAKKQCEGKEDTHTVEKVVGDSDKYECKKKSDIDGDDVVTEYDFDVSGTEFDGLKLEDNDEFKATTTTVNDAKPLTFSYDKTDTFIFVDKKAFDGFITLLTKEEGAASGGYVNDSATVELKLELGNKGAVLKGVALYTFLIGFLTETDTKEELTTFFKEGDSSISEDSVALKEVKEVLDSLK